ncbi:MAG: solute carrier family 23 protein [Pleomorphochaeta sp.]
MYKLNYSIININPVTTAKIFQLPHFMPFGISFKFSAFTALGILFKKNAIQAIGDFSAITIRGLDRKPTNSELQGGIIEYVISNIIVSFFGGFPTSTYSQNIGIVASTKVVNRITLGLSATILLIAGLIPKFSAILTTIPQCVLGGATISVFASIAMTGMKLVTSEKMNYRNSSIVWLSAALGVGISQASGAIANFPSWFIMIFGKFPVVLATLTAVILNIILPKDQESKNE